MLSQASSHGRPLLLFAFMAGFWHGAHALSQTYCSSQNTGSDYDAVTNIYQSNGACEEQCVDSYAFAIVQYKQCWCSNYAPADQVDVSDCSDACPGYPDESCGNEDKSLYGYITLSISPSGTQGSGSSSTSTSSSAAASSTEQSTPTSSPTSSPTAASSSSIQSDNTVFTSVSVTVTVQQSASVVVSYVTVSSSSEPSTTSSPSSTSSSSTSPSSTSTEASTTSSSLAITSTQAAVTSSASSSDTSSASHTTTFVSTRVVTVSGAAVTQTVTSTAVVGPGAATSEKESANKSVSGGTVAGAVIGSIAGVALLLAGAFFLWRRRRSDPSDPESPRSSSGSSRKSAKRMERNTSVLSKTGLLSSAANTANAEKFPDDPSPVGAANHRYNTSDSVGPVPSSPGGGSNRRDSRPLFYDQRLNPAALMENWERNGSRASIGTMQDQRDYSRPLGVTNPDPVDDE